MTDLTKLKELAERALLFAPGDWFVENGMDQVRDAENDFVCETGEGEPIKAAFIAAANPQAIFGLIERLEQAESDAKRYRWLRDLPEDSPHERIGNFPGWMWDEEIDKGMADEAMEGGGR